MATTRPALFSASVAVGATPAIFAATGKRLRKIPPVAQAPVVAPAPPPAPVLTPPRLEIVDDNGVARISGVVHDDALVAFDLLRRDGDDMRGWPIEARRSALLRLVARRRSDGVVSKRAGSAYQSGPSRAWLKTKNPDFVRT